MDATAFPAVAITAAANSVAARSLQDEFIWWSPSRIDHWLGSSRLELFAGRNTCPSGTATTHHRFTHRQLISPRRFCSPRNLPRGPRLPRTARDGCCHDFCPARGAAPPLAVAPEAMLAMFPAMLGAVLTTVTTARAAARMMVFIGFPSREYS